MPLLAVENVSVVKQEKQLLENINFTLNQQEVLVILGPNGAGKTTLLKALLSLIPFQGNITWKTNKISYLPPQETLLRQSLPPFTVQDFFSLKGSSHNATASALESVNLDLKVINQQFAALSTGQFQRILIAWALISNPEVLLFDEPTSGIDVGGEETIYSLLHTFWKERKISIILVTHNLQLVWEHATKVICLDKKILCQGSPEKILTPEVLKKLYGSEVKIYEHRHH